MILPAVARSFDPHADPAIENIVAETFGSIPNADRPVLIADLFCGAGGSSTGALRALRAMGIEPVLTCCNHWPVAIETHRANHPEARHFIEDLSTADPLQLVPEGYLDLLMASPTCTHFSRARGNKPTSDQQRSDPYHILEWLTCLDVKRLLVENVPEMMDWGPVNVRTGRPIKSRKGEYFNAWIQSLKDLGFTDISWTVLNAADYGDGTTRRRFFLQARSDGVSVAFPAQTHSEHGEPDLFGNGGKKHRAAREFIDWNDAGRSIFDRKRPLAPNTIRRVATGLARFNGDSALPFLHVLKAEGMLPSDFEIPEPKDPKNLRSLAYQTSKGDVVEIIRDDRVHREPATAPEAGEPIIFQVNQGNGRFGSHRPASEPLYTIVTRDSQGVATPTLTPVHGANRTNNAARSPDEPTACITTAPGGGLFVAPPTAEPLSPFVLGQHGGATARSTDEALPTIATAGYIRLFTATKEPEPYLTIVNHGDDASGNCDRRVKSIERPLPTITTAPSFALAQPRAFLSPYYGNSTPSAVTSPVPVITTHGRHALCQPFLVPQFGERAGQRPRTHNINDPLPAVTSHGAGALVEPVAMKRTKKSGRLVWLNGIAIRIDILFRMLRNRELAAAMGFTAEDDYEFCGTKTEITRQIGNAVPVHTATALVTSICGDLDETSQLCAA